MHSCCSTVFMLSSYFTGYTFTTASRSYRTSSLPKIPSATAAIASSRGMAPLTATRGWRARIVSKRSLTSFCAHVMSALSCRPKISGLGLIGNVRM
jgi:hypothetical protein